MSSDHALASTVDNLQQRCRASWATMTAARTRAEELIAKIESHGIRLPDVTSLVVFGSVGRGEVTEGSDVDWTVLVDGPAHPEHLRLVHTIRAVVSGVGKPAGQTFPGLTSSHDLIHHIGGLQDTNINLTHRMLLLLESRAVNNPLVRKRVIGGILERYISASESVGWNSHPEYLVPRFLLNDVIRYWRTMAVDYAAKRWEQDDYKWGIRNAKLRLSRKLLLVTGLLLCFRAELHRGAEREKIMSAGRDLRITSFTTFLLRDIDKTPLERLAETLLTLDDDGATIGTVIFGAYDEFLQVLSSPRNRLDLENLMFERAAEDDLYLRVRAIGRRFQAGLDQLFFETTPLNKLIRRYGVF